MSETTKKNIITVIIVGLILVIIYLTFDVIKSKKQLAVDTDNNAILNENNTNLKNEVVENTTNSNVENTSVTENTQNTETTSNTENKNDDEIYNEPLISKEEKAIELVKKDWGSSDGVYFTKVAINSRGNYVISVNDSNTSKTLAFYEVDLNNETVKRK